MVCANLHSLIIILASSMLILSGCADSRTNQARPETIPSESANNVSIETGPPTVGMAEDTTTSVTQDKSVDATDAGVLNKATELFEKAKTTSGNTASEASQWVQETLGSAAKTGDQTADEAWKWANETFESLKAQGLTSATSTSQWLGQDWQNMESWQYKLITVSGNDEEIAAQLNKLGSSGWECFDTSETTDGTRFYLKKPTFSYLRHLPFKDVIKLVPMMNNGEK